MKRQNVTSGSPYEEPIGFSRAVRIGNQIFVAGTGPIADDGSTTAPSDAYKQASRCLAIIKKAIETAGGSITDVVRTRMYLTDISKWEEVGRAHGGYFSSIKPASTLLEVKGLARDDWLVEIEADCVITDSD